MKSTGDAAAAHLRHASAVASAARAASSRGDHMLAMLATLEVLPDPERGRDLPASSAAAAALREAWLGNRERHVLRGHDGTVKFAFFTPDARRVVSVGNDDGTVRLWHLEGVFPEGMVVASFDTYAEHSPDGRWLYVRDKEKRTWLHDFGRDPAVPHPISDHGGPSDWAMFSPDSRWMVTQEVSARGGGPGMILWGLHADPPAPIWLDLPDNTRFAVIGFSADGRHLLAQSAEHALHLFDLTNGGGSARVMRLFGSRVIQARFSQDGSDLVTISFGNRGRPSQIRRSNLTDDLPHSGLLTTTELGNRISRLSPSGRYLVTITDEGIASLQDLATRPVPAPQRLHGHFGPVRNAVFSATEMLATFGHNGTTCVWSCQDPRPAGFGWVHAGPVLCASFAPLADSFEGSDPRFPPLATGGEDGLVCLYGADGGGTVAGTVGYSGLYWPQIALGRTEEAADRSWVPADADDAGDWPTMTYPLRGLARLRGHEARVHHLAFSADGQWLVSASADGTARVWDARPTYERQATSIRSTGYADRIALTAAGEATGPSVRSDCEGLLWLSEPGEGPANEACLGLFPPHAFDDFGRPVAWGHSDFTTRCHEYTQQHGGQAYWWAGHWDMICGRRDEVWFAPTLEVLVPLAKAVLTRTLTADERNAFGLWPASDRET